MNLTTQTRCDSTGSTKLQQLNLHKYRARHHENTHTNPVHQNNQSAPTRTPKAPWKKTNRALQVSSSQIRAHRAPRFARGSQCIRNQTPSSRLAIKQCQDAFKGDWILRRSRGPPSGDETMGGGEALTWLRLSSAALRSSGTWLSAARSTTARLGRSMSTCANGCGCGLCRREAGGRRRRPRGPT